MSGHYRFRRSFGNVSSRFRGAIPKHFPLTDPDVLAFAAESGATDLDGLDDLVKYLKAEGLYDNFVIYPMKAAQNAGSGSTLYGLGGLTANNMTLANDPSWGATGISYDGVDQYASGADFLGSETILIFSRANVNVATAVGSAIFSQYDIGDNGRSFSMNWRGAGGGKLQLSRSSDGTSANLEQYQSVTTDFRGADNCISSKWVSGGGREAWINKVSESISLLSGSAQTERFNSGSAISIAAYFNSGSPAALATMTGIASAICNIDITTTQRETITDLINAL